MRVRPIDPTSAAEIALVAERMRATLVEVLGEARGTSMYSLEWLVERVRFHLDPAREAAVFVAEDAGGEIVGHSIVRSELDDEQRAFGLVSTTYVLPSHRRLGLASALLAHEEAWMRERGLERAATDTARDNHRLIALYRKHGYEIALEAGEMVRLEREL